MKNKIKKFFARNIFLKIISLLIGIIAWFAVVTLVDDTTVTMISDIPIQINLEDTQAQTLGLNIISGGEQTVNITVKGAIVKLARLEAKDFSATAQTSTVNTAGDFELAVTVNKRNTTDKDFDVISQSVSTIKVKFDYMSEKNFPIVGEAEKITAKDGYLKEAAIASPDKLDIVGPRSQIEKIAKVALVTDVEKVETQNVITDGKLVFYDEKGEVLKLENVNYLDSKFTITVPILKKKAVPLKINYVNVPSTVDIDRIKYTTSNSAINIAGSEKRVDDINYLSVGDIDFRKLDIGSIFELDVDIPGGISNIDEISKVTVKFDDPNLDFTHINLTNILTKNESASYDVVVESKSIQNVKIVGEKSVIENLSPSDFVATLDLIEDVRLSEGTMRVPISVYPANKMQAWAVGEYSIVISATKKE